MLHILLGPTVGGLLGFSQAGVFLILLLPQSELSGHHKSSESSTSFPISGEYRKLKSCEGLVGGVLHDWPAGPSAISSSSSSINDDSHVH